MTAPPKPEPTTNGKVAESGGDRPALLAEGPSGGAVGLAVAQPVPAQLLNGDEIILFAIKPSAWFVLLVSLRWIAAAIILALLAEAQFMPAAYRWYLYQAAMWLTAARLVWATLEWVSRQYVLTNRRVMRLHGVFEVDLFECSLTRIQSTSATFTLPERIFRVGTIRFETAGGAGITGGGASWRMVARPLEVHQKLREAIRRAQNRGGNGV